MLLDIGCCCESFGATNPASTYVHRGLIYLVGNDVRIAAANGFPAKQIVATDLYGGSCLLTWLLGGRLLATLKSLS